MDSNTVYRWVKASEKTPEPLTDVFFLNGLTASTGFYNQKRNEFYCCRRSEYVEGLEEIEWLEEIPASSLLSGVLEEAVKWCEEEIQDAQEKKTDEPGYIFKIIALKDCKAKLLSLINVPEGGNK